MWIAPRMLLVLLVIVIVMRIWKASIEADADDGQLMSFRLSPAAIEIGQLFRSCHALGYSILTQGGASFVLLMHKLNKLLN